MVIQDLFWWVQWSQHCARIQHCWNRSLLNQRLGQNRKLKPEHLWTQKLLLMIIYLSFIFFFCSTSLIVSFTPLLVSDSTSETQKKVSVFKVLVKTGKRKSKIICSQNIFFSLKSLILSVLSHQHLLSGVLFAWGRVLNCFTIILYDVFIPNIHCIHMEKDVYRDECRENKILNICGQQTSVGQAHTCWFICFVKSSQCQQDLILLWTEVTNGWRDIPINKHPWRQENLEVVCGQKVCTEMCGGNEIYTTSPGYTKICFWIREIF